MADNKAGNGSKLGAFDDTKRTGGAAGTLQEHSRIVDTSFAIRREHYEMILRSSQ